MGDFFFPAVKMTSVKFFHSEEDGGQGKNTYLMYICCASPDDA